jgi:hypothetical protein
MKLDKTSVSTVAVIPITTALIAANQRINRKGRTRFEGVMSHAEAIAGGMQQPHARGMLRAQAVPQNNAARPHKR